MTYYDFVVTNRENVDNDRVIKHKFTVEKVALVDDDVTLEQRLKEYGVEDSAIGAVIEQLEGLPYGAKHAYAVGSSGRILIEQV